jgi:uncharacterized membrane protein
MRRSRSPAIALCLLSAEAAAQHSGGRSGSSSFGGGRSSSSSSHSSSSYSGGRPSSSSAPARPVRVAPWRRAAPAARPGELVAPPTAPPAVPPDERAAAAALPVRYTDPSLPAGVVTFGLTFGALGALVWRLTRPRPPAPPGAPRRGPFPGCDLRRVSVGFDGGARPTLQRELRAIAARNDPADPRARHRSVTEVVALLAAHLASARYACLQSAAMTPAAAEGAFERLATDLRGRYLVEAVSNRQVIAAPAVAARAEEGPGMLVVSVLVASTEDLPELDGAPSPQGLRDALARLAPSRGEAMAGYELIWSPSDEADRMSSAELEERYPELAKLDPASAFGRAQCAYCRAVYARELGRCPGCGHPPGP